MGLGDVSDKASCADTSDDIEGWRSRIDQSIARSRKVRGANYVQIATVDESGMPKCRTVVFRGFQPLNEQGSVEAMKMITDARSEKVAQLAHNNKCEMVWWFAKSSEQYRISGELRLVGENESDPFLLAARKQQWGNISDAAREQFFWHAPGVPFDSKPEVPAAGRDEEGRILDVPSTFLLTLLIPSSVKYLRLTDNFAQLDDEAGARRVNP